MLFNLLIHSSEQCRVRITINPGSDNAFANLTGDVLDVAIVENVGKQNDTNGRVTLNKLHIKELNHRVFKNFQQMTSIDLSFNEIEKIAEKIFTENSKLEKVQLEGNRIQKIQKNLLHGEFPELVDINLSENYIKEVEAGAFDKVPELQTLDLSSNCLTTVGAFLFKKNTKLKEVFLNDNEILKIDGEAFAGKCSLDILNLSANKLEKFPLMSMDKIDTFNLNDNNIRTLDVSTPLGKMNKKFARIITLKLSGNKINKLESSGAHRHDLESLDLSNNSLSEIDQFPTFVNLKRLYLEHNNISWIDNHEIVRKFESIMYLDISYNPLECLEYVHLKELLNEDDIVLHSNLRAECNHTLSVDYESMILTELSSSFETLNENVIINRNLLIVLATILIIALLTCAVMFVKRFLSAHKSNLKGLVEQIEL